MASKEKKSESGRKSANDSEHLSQGQQDQADEHASPRALVIHEIIRKDGELELLRTPSALCLSGLAAGLSMGFSFLALALLHAALPDTPWRHAVESFGYSIGFIIVILGRQQLFTESTLTAVLPVLTKRDLKTLFLAARLWIIVLAVNLIGTWLFACFLTVKSVFAPETSRALGEISLMAMNPLWMSTFLKAGMAGWLIALMVWILPSAESARLWTIVIITYVVSLTQLSHVIAGSAEAAYAVLTHLATLEDYCFRFLIPTLLGNIVGGVALVSLLNHGSILPEMGKGEGGEGGDAEQDDADDSQARNKKRRP